MTQVNRKTLYMNTMKASILDKDTAQILTHSTSCAANMAAAHLGREPQGLGDIP